MVGSTGKGSGTEIASITDPWNTSETFLRCCGSDLFGRGSSRWGGGMIATRWVRTRRRGGKDLREASSTEPFSHAVKKNRKVVVFCKR
jgi:hypothetical protein